VLGAEAGAGEVAAEVVETSGVGIGEVGDSTGQKVADKVLEGAEKLPNRRNHFTDQFQKHGGAEQAQKDFKELANKGSIEQIQGKPEGWLKGKTADGSNVSVRPDSSGGKPTIQIDKPDGHTIKIRY